MPVLLGDTFASPDPVLWGFGPASRYSPDCRDGDLAYDFANQDPPEHSLYVNTLELSSGASLQTGTDPLGQWAHQLTLSDGTWELTQDGVTGASLQRGRVGRELLAADGVTVLAGLAATVASTGQRGPTDLIVDSSITDLAPQVSFVPAEVLVESPLPEGAGLLRFRLVDADHDVPLDGITVTNLSVTDPVATPAFYAAEQVDVDHGDWGWFVAELMLAEGMNTIEICAEDSQGHGLGTSTACVTHQVERRSPLVQAVVTSPDPDVSHAVRATEIIEFDGRASVIPEGGVGVWTLGTTSYLITPASWDPVTTRAQVDDVSQLATSFAVPVGQSLLVRARLVVAASPADLPADLWPDNGDLPCEGFEGEGRCDSVDVVLSRPCHRAPNSVIVYVDEPATSFLAVTPDETFRLRAHVNETETYAFRWVVQDVNDLVPEWWSTPLGPTVDNEGFSVANADLETSAALEGLPMGEYTIRAEARWPEYGCETSGYGWWYGATGSMTLRVNHTFDGVAPGQVVEDGTFRVYSRSAAEGSAAVVRIDDDLDDATPPVTYPATVTTGGAIEITPAAGELPASAERYWVQIAADADGAGGSTWVRALQIVAPGSVDTPLVVTNEEDPSCGGQGSECTHPIVPGQTWQGEWGEPGDTDYFGFIAGAGTEIRLTLDRQDLTLPPLHPDAPSPEILLIRPDGLVYAASEPLGLDATGTVLEAVLPDDGQHAIAVRTSKGTGSYLLTLTTLAEGGSGEAVFGTTRQRAHLTTPSAPQAQLSVPLLDAFGNPTSGAEITWVEGTDCAEGFCATGTQVTHRSSTDGFAWHEVTTTETSAPLWRPGLESATLLRAPAETMTAHRLAVAERLARAAARQPILGRVQVDGFAVRSASLPSLHRAKALRAEAGRRADRLEAQSALEPRLKDGPSCGDNGITCSTDAAPEFRAVQLDAAADEQLVSVSLRLLDGPEEVTELDGHEIHSAIPLFLEANAVLRDGEGTERTIEITDPVAMVVTDDYGAGIEQAGSVCPYAALVPGSFTYWVGSHAAMQYQYDDPGTGEPCCWQPTEYLLATVVAEVEVDDGQGGSTLVRRATEIEVPSKPRPAATCELRPYPAGDGGPLEIAGDGPRASAEGFFSQWVGSVYQVDACGNIVITDQAPQVAGVAPSDPDVWSTVQPTSSHWEWQILLHGSASVSPDGTPLYYIPPNQYTVTLEADAATDCAPSGVTTYDHVIDYADSRPQIQLVWDAIRGDEPQDLTASPGAALRDPATGELATWRIRPGESGYWHTGQSWQDVPVRLYVAERRVYWNDDGTVAEDLKPVPDVELCIGALHQSYDPASDDYPGDITVTCDDTHTGEVTITASTEPDTALEPGVAFDGDVGPVVGLKQAPEEGGEYVLVAEPVEDDPVAEPFRRGDAWRLATAATGVRFSVWGGQYLNESYEPYSKAIHVPGERPVYIDLQLPSQSASETVSVAAVENGTAVSTVSAVLDRVAGDADGGRYFGELVLSNAAESGELAIPEHSLIATSFLGSRVLENPAVDLRIQVDEIAFNHDTESFDTDALNIRHDYETVIELPEWKRGERNAPAAYVRNTPATLKVKLSSNAADPITIEIQGISTDTDGVMGDTEPVTVNLEPSEAATGDFPLANLLLDSLARGVESWDWCMLELDDVRFPAEVTMDATSGHEVFVLWGRPVHPWLEDAESDQTPWVTVLRAVIGGIEDSSVDPPFSERSLVKGVTAVAFSDFQMRYDTDFDSRSYFDTLAGEFYLSDYLDYEHPDDHPRDVVCHDQSAAVLVLSGAIGVNAPILVWDSFGFVQSVGLVGVEGLSNNPVWERADVPPVGGQWSTIQNIQTFLEIDGTLYRNRDITGGYRTMFSSHSTNTIASPDNPVFDASVGPVLGSSVSAYTANTIDIEPYAQLSVDYSGNAACAVNEDGSLRIELLPRMVLHVH